jgi:hypothetical protein
MADRRFLVRLKPPAMTRYLVLAQRAMIEGEHIVFSDSDGKPVAVFLMKIVESWSESDV